MMKFCQMAFVLSLGLLFQGLGAKEGASLLSVCDRTPQVRDALVTALKMPCEKIDAADLARITHLDFYKKGIVSLRANDLEGLVKLQSLALSKNRLREIPENIFLSTPNLEVLSLDDNRLREITNSSLNGLEHKLRTLYVSNNESYFSLVLENFARLANLFADSRGGVDQGHIALKNLPELKHLGLAGHGLSDLRFGILEMPLLESVDLSRNGLKSVDGLEKLASLRRVILDDNQIEVFPVALLFSDDMQELSLNRNQIGHFFDYSPLDGRSIRLKILSIEGNPVDNPAKFPDWFKRDVVKEFPYLKWYTTNSCLKAARAIIS